MSRSMMVMVGQRQSPFLVWELSRSIAVVLCFFERNPSKEMKVVHRGHLGRQDVLVPPLKSCYHHRMWPLPSFWSTRTGIWGWPKLEIVST